MDLYYLIIYYLTIIKNDKPAYLKATELYKDIFDVYCLPEKSKILFEKCVSENKQIEWFEGAEHSRVRLFDENRYDALIKDFLARN